MKKLSKLKLQETNFMNDNEMKNITGGGASITGYRCYNKTCFIDVDWGDGSYECEIATGLTTCYKAGVYC